jgi:hypothetical protein
MFGLTNRDYAVLLLEDIDLEAQLFAIRRLLRRNSGVDEALAQEIENLAKRANEASGEYDLHLTNTWVDHLHDSVFQDAAHSMSACGMLVPMLESLFVATFAGMRDLESPVTPVTPTGTRAAHLAHKHFWDPHYYFSTAGKANTGIALGTEQLAETTGLTPHLPTDTMQLLDALFTYRNRMFHKGFEWPMAERKKFAKLIADKGWPADWFVKSTTNHEPWIFYMSDTLIQLSLTRIDEILEGIGIFILARYP